MSNIEEEQQCKQVPLEELINEWRKIGPEMNNELRNLHTFLMHTSYEVKAYYHNKTGEYFWTSNLNPRSEGHHV